MFRHLARGEVTSEAGRTARAGGRVMVLATSLFSEAALRFVLLGLATGALTALVALAIVLVDRASGALKVSADDVAHVQSGPPLEATRDVEPEPLGDAVRKR